SHATTASSRAWGPCSRCCSPARCLRRCCAPPWSGATGTARASDVSPDPRCRARGRRAHATLDHVPVEGEFRESGCSTSLNVTSTARRCKSSPVLEAFSDWVQGIVRAGGYPVVFALIALESTLVPIPSELVMPFAGFMAWKGEFSLPVILVINSVGAMVGSGICYWIGVVGGKPFLVKYGKYFLVRQHEIVRPEAFFARHGKTTILIGRFLPVIRHIISVPAGIARMPLPGFFLQTFLGATIW